MKKKIMIDDIVLEFLDYFSEPPCASEYCEDGVGRPYKIAQLQMQNLGWCEEHCSECDKKDDYKPCWKKFFELAKEEKESGKTNCN